MEEKIYQLTNKVREIIKSDASDTKKKQDFYLIVDELRKRYSVYSVLDDFTRRNIEGGYFVALEKSINDKNPIFIESHVQALEILLTRLK